MCSRALLTSYVIEKISIVINNILILFSKIFLRISLKIILKFLCIKNPKNFCIFFTAETYQYVGGKRRTARCSNRTSIYIPQGATA